VIYDRARYARYSELPLADEAKKALELEVVTEMVGEMPGGGRALDIGTATGRYAGFLAARGFEVVGIDVSPDALLVASNNLRQIGLECKVTLREMDVLGLDLPSESFGLVTCMMGTFCHVPSVDQPAALDRIGRVLRPGGLAILSCWDPECPFTNFLSIYDGAERRELLVNSPPSGLLGRWMRERGFGSVEVHAVCCFPDEQVVQLVSQEGEYGPLADLQRYLWARFPLLKGQLYVVVGRKGQTGGGTP
jgi:SAM-dependent methyltransferase